MRNTLLQAIEKGLTDDEIIKSLGTPEIYASYVDAGIITDTLNEDGNTTSKSVTKYAKKSMLDLQ